MMNRIFSAIREYDNQSTSPKACKSCGQPATADALFEVGNDIMLIERYCGECAKTVENSRGSG